jgi:hypothetical protein
MAETEGGRLKEWSTYLDMIPLHLHLSFSTMGWRPLGFRGPIQGTLVFVVGHAPFNLTSKRQVVQQLVLRDGSPDNTVFNTILGSE